MNKALIAIDRSKSFRVYLTISTDLVQEAAKIHDTTPLASAGLGRVLTAAGLMGIMLKDDDNKLTLHFKGDGPARQILATAYGDGRVKGYISNPYVDLPLNDQGKLDVGGAVGKDGFLTVIRDVGLKDAYVGKTELRSGEIAEDLAYYFLQSEQQPSIVYLSVWVDIDTSVLRAGGLIISPMPGASEETLSDIESRLFDIQNYAMLLLSKSPAEAVKTIFAGMDVKELDTREPRYHCDCSREKLEQVIISLGREEITDMIEKDGQAEIVCRFCNKKYLFDAEALRRLLQEATH